MCPSTMFSIFLIVLVIGTGSSNARYIRTMSDLVQSTDADFVENPNTALSSNFSASKVAENEHNDGFDTNANLKLIPTSNYDEHAEDGLITENPTDLVTSLGISNLTAESDGRKVTETEKMDGIADILPSEVQPESHAAKTIVLESTHGGLEDANVEDESEKMEQVTELESTRTTLVDTELVSDVENGDVGKVTETVESQTTAEITNEKPNVRVVDVVTVEDTTFKDDVTPIIDSVTPAGSLDTEKLEELILQGATEAAHIADASEDIVNTQNSPTTAAEVKSNEFSTSVTEISPSKVHTECDPTKTIPLENSLDSSAVTSATAESSFDSTAVASATAEPGIQESKNDELPTNDNTQSSPLQPLNVSGPADQTSNTGLKIDSMKSDTTINILNITSNVEPTRFIEVRIVSNNSETAKDIKELNNSYNPTTQKSIREEKTPTTVRPIENPQQRVYEIPRPLDVQPSRDAIEDLIEEVIGTLNAPIEVEELIEKEIVDSMRGISATESWHEIKPVKPLVEFRSPDLYQKVQTSHEKEEEEEEDFSNEITNSVHEVSYLLPSSAERNKAKIDAQLKNTELEHVVEENDQTNQRLVETTASLTPSRVEQHLELPESDNEVMSVDKIAEKTKANDLSHLPPLGASVPLEEPDLPVRLEEPAFKKLDSHPVTPSLNTDFSSSQNKEKSESGIKIASPQSVQKKQHYDRILTFVINYGGDTTNADDIFQFTDNIETKTIVASTDSDHKSQVIATKVLSSSVQNDTSIKQVEVKDVPNDAENILSETSSISMESLRSTQNATADTEQTNEVAFDLAENVNDVTSTDDTETKQIGLEPSVSVKEEVLTEKPGEVAINSPTDNNSSPALHSKSTSLPVLDKNAIKDINEAIELTNQVESTEKNIPIPGVGRSTEAVKVSPHSDNYDASVTAEPVYEKGQHENRIQIGKDSFSQTDLMPAENERLDSAVVNGTSSRTSDFGSIPRSKLQNGDFSPQTEAKSVITHLSTDATLPAGDVTGKHSTRINSETAKIESSEEDIAFTPPVKEAESSSVESHEHGVDNIENVADQGPVITLSLDLSVMTNGNDMSKPMEVLSTDSINENADQTVTSNVTPSPNVATGEVQPTDNSRSSIQVNHALRNLPTSITVHPNSATVNTQQISHPAATIVVSVKSTVTKDQNKNAAHSTLQAESSEESHEQLYPTATAAATTNVDLSPTELQNKVNGIKLQKVPSEETKISMTAVQFENHSFESVEHFEESEEDQRDDFVKSTQSKQSQIVESKATVDHHISKNNALDTKPTQKDAENELDRSSASYQMDEEDTYRSHFEAAPRSYSFENYPRSSETDNQLIFHGRSMGSDDLIRPPQYSGPSDFVPTKVEFDTVGLSIKNQKQSEGSERAQVDSPGHEASKNNLVEAIVEAAELTTEMNRFIVTFRPSVAPNDAISVSPTESTRDAVNSKVVESRFLAINSADQYPQAASINITMTVILSITLLTLTIVLLIFFGIRMRNRHGDLNIEMLEQQGNTFAAGTALQNARNPL